MNTDARLKTQRLVSVPVIDQGSKPNIFSNLDFTSNKYEKLCKAIIESKYRCITLADYLLLSPEQKRKSFIILRHDIDRTPQRALEIAQIENKYDLRATYYFRFIRRIYVTDILDKIAAIKHEIGFHYETIDKCKGNVEEAKYLFKKELADFRKRYDIKTVCAHGNPLTKYDNKDIWKTLKLAEFGLLGEAFLTLDFRKFAYFSDSGRTWEKNKSQKMPGKDDVTTAFDDVRPESTDDIIRIIKEVDLPNICILTHCERWSRDTAGFLRRYLLDLAYSGGKVAINAYRSTTK